MSESVDKAARRDLRRAVGGEALAVVDAHSTALERVVAGLQGMHERLTRVEQAISDERTQRLQLAQEQRAYVNKAEHQLWIRIEERRSSILMEVGVAIGELRARGFWRRFRWLLTGV